MASDAENTTRLKRDIIQCLQDREQSLSVFRNLIASKDVVIFLGNTRSGKSTLVNYIIGNELVGWESGKKEFKIIIKEEGDGPEIGQGSLSCTDLPGVYAMEESADVVIVDPPGFEDNRGGVQDIINALCISQIVYARTVKFVLVSDINEITSDNIRNFTNSLHQVQDLVSNFDELKRSFAFVFTKDWKDYTREEIIDLLRNKILNQDQMDVNKTLIENVVQNKKLIGIFKMPTQEGNISDELAVNIKGAVKECHAVDVEKCKIKFAFSDKAQEALLQIYPEYTDTNYFKDETDEIIKRHNKYFSVDKYVFASYNNELATVKTDLEKTASELQKHQGEERQQLFEIQKSLDELLELPSSAEFKTNFKFVIMLDQSAMLAQQYKDIIKNNYVQSLSNLHAKVTELLKKIDGELNERKKNNIIFAAAGVVGAVGAVPAIAGAAKAIDCTVKAGSALQRVLSPAVGVYSAAEAGIGGAATAGVCIAGAAVVGAGAGAAYVLYKQTYGRRKEARGAQNRP